MDVTSEDDLGQSFRAVCRYRTGMPGNNLFRAFNAVVTDWLHAAIRLQRQHMLPILLAMAAAYCLPQRSFAAEQSCGPANGGPPGSCPASSVASTDGNGGADAGAGNPINVSG